MPTKKKPRWNYQGRHLLSNDGIEIYSDHAIDQLASEYEITNDGQVLELKERLEGAANVYRIYLQNNDNAPRPGEMKAAVLEIEHHIDTLLDKLNRLDGWTARTFWRPEIDLLNLADSGDMPTETTILETKYGHSIVKEPIGDDACQISYLSRPDYFQSLHILKNYCSVALQTIPDDKGAARKSEAIRMWTINVRNFWVDCLHRPFTLDLEKGEPISNAALFCRDAFRVVEPKLPHSKVMGAMKNLISSERRRGTGKNTPP